MTPASRATPARLRALAVLLVGLAACGERSHPGGDFDARVRDYLALRARLAAELDPPAPTADAVALDARRRALATKLADALGGSERHPIFTREAADDLRGRLARVLHGPDGANVRGVILDANPSGVHVAAGAPYPAAAPLSTVPPGVLAALPPLPDAVEYRFVDRALILRDVEANFVVDVLPDALA